jgi:cytochrome b561
MPPLHHLTSCTTTKSNLHLTNSLATVVREPGTWPIQAPYIPGNEPHIPFPLLRLHQSIGPVLRHVFMFRNKASFYSVQLSAPCSTPKLEDYPLSAVHNCLFNTFAATLHIGGRSSIRNLKTRHTVVTGTLLSWFLTVTTYNLLQLRKQSHCKV